MTTLLPENMFGRLTKLLRFGQFYLALAATNFLLAAVGFGCSRMAGDFAVVLFAMGLALLLGGLVIISNCLLGARIDRSTVTLAQESIQVKDHRGRIWRDIPYSAITAVKKSPTPEISSTCGHVPALKRNTILRSRPGIISASI